MVYKVGGVLDFLVLLGVWVVFLFVCFADFNSVVFVWSKVGACLRKVRAMTVGVLCGYFRSFSYCNWCGP